MTHVHGNGKGHPLTFRCGWASNDDVPVLGSFPVHQLVRHKNVEARKVNVRVELFKEEVWRHLALGHGQDHLQWTSCGALASHPSSALWEGVDVRPR